MRIAIGVVSLVMGIGIGYLFTNSPAERPVKETGISFTCTKPTSLHPQIAKLTPDTCTIN